MTLIELKKNGFLIALFKLQSAIIRKNQFHLCAILNIEIRNR